MWQAIKVTLGSVWGWIGILVGSLSLANLIMMASVDGGSAVVAQMLTTYRDVAHLVIDISLFWLADVWPNYVMSDMLKDMLFGYSLLVALGMRLQVIQPVLEPGASLFYPTAIVRRLYRAAIEYPMLLTFPITVVTTAVLLIIDPGGFVADIPSRLGVEEQDAAWFLGTILFVSGLVGAYKQFKIETWNVPEQRQMFFEYTIQISFGVLFFLGSLATASF